MTFPLVGGEFLLSLKPEGTTLGPAEERVGLLVTSCVSQQFPLGGEHGLTVTTRVVSHG